MRISELPPEIQASILCYLNPFELALSAKVCKIWRELSKNLFKRHYFSLPFAPLRTDNWSLAYSEKMKISNNIRNKRFYPTHLNDLPDHLKTPWIERVKKDTVLPITTFGDYFSYAELDSFQINGKSYPILDSTDAGTLVYASARTLYYFTGTKYTLDCPFGYCFKASLKAVILGSWDFIIPTVNESGGIQIFRFHKHRWTKLMPIAKAPFFKILYDSEQLITQITETEIHIYPLHKLLPKFILSFTEPIRCLKVNHGMLHVFSGSVGWQAYDITAGKLLIDTAYRVKNARFLTERKFTQIVSRKAIAYKANKNEIFEIDLPPFAKIIKAIWAEKMIFFAYSFEELFFVEAYDVIKKERINFPKEARGFVFHLPINIYYENGYLLCHSRLFEIAFLFNFRVGI